MQYILLYETRLNHKYLKILLHINSMNSLIIIIEYDVLHCLYIYIKHIKLKFK